MHQNWNCLKCLVKIEIPRPSHGLRKAGIWRGVEDSSFSYVFQLHRCPSFLELSHSHSETCVFLHFNMFWVESFLFAGFLKMKDAWPFDIKNIKSMKGCTVNYTLGFGALCSSKPLVCINSVNPVTIHWGRVPVVQEENSPERPGYFFFSEYLARKWWGCLRVWL